MTKLFQEYEIQRLARENPQSLVGKKFRWNSSKRPFTITKVIYDDYMEYQYQYGDISRNFLSVILDLSTPITE